MKPDEKALAQLLRKEQAAFLRFEKVLDDECQALVSGTPDALLAVVDQKSALVEELNQLAVERAALLTNLGVSSEDPKQVKDWFEARPAKDTLLQEWQRLLEAGRAVIVRNACNGKLINQRMESTQASLHVLQKAAGTPELYGRDGRIKSPFAAKGYE